MSCWPSATRARDGHEVTKHLFEPFFTTKAAGEGTGLGLATVFGVVKQSGGGIYVYSEPGRGSTFKIYLPAATTAAEATGAPRARGRARTETIMVVEDDDGVRALVQLMLEANGYEVLAVTMPARPPGSASSDVDLLLTDVDDARSPAQLAERLRGLAPRMRILFMSGYSDEAGQRHGELTASAAFLEKPFTQREWRAKCARSSTPRARCKGGGGGGGGAEDRSRGGGWVERGAEGGGAASLCPAEGEE